MIMGVIAILYTALGGLKAVIYTDTIQWIILMIGLIIIGIVASVIMYISVAAVGKIV